MNKFNSRFNPDSQLARSAYIAVAMVFSIALGVKASTTPHNDTTSGNQVSVAAQPVLTTKTATTTEVIPYTTTYTYWNDKNRIVGSQTIGTYGISGSKTTTWTVSYSDSTETGRKKISETVTKDPVNQIVIVGTYVTPSYCPNGSYTNTYGNIVCSPYSSPTTPSGASAICRDGTYSFSQSRSGTCSHHGGVAQWL